MSTTSPAFWDGVARRYSDMKMRNPDEYEKTLALVRAYLEPDDRVLELGCGTGTTAITLAGNVGQYIASDYSSEMIAIADEKRSGSAIANLEFHVGKLGDGSLPEGSFDVVLGFNLLHLLPDRPQAFTEIAKTLKQGGFFISKTPCLGGIFRVLQPVVAALRIMGKAPEFHFVSPARLEQEIRQAGFEIVETGDYPKRPARRFIVAKKSASPF